LKLLALAKG